MSDERKELNISNITDNNLVLTNEQRLLNAIYLDPSILDNTDYNEDLFIHSSAKAIARSMAELVKNNIDLNDQSIYTEVLKYDMTLSKDPVDAIIALNSTPVKSIKDIITNLKSTKVSVEADEKLKSIQNVVLSNPNLTDQIKDSLRDEISELEEILLSNNNNNFKKAMTTSEWMTDYVDEFKKRRDGKQYWFNEPVLDKIVVDGPIPETGGIIAAQSGMGKSTFVLNLVNKFVDSGIPCMYFSLEMGAVSTMDRLLAARLKIPYKEIVNPPDTETFYTIYNRIQEERKKIELNKNFRFSENPDISINELKKEIKKFQNEIGQQYCVVIIDLITMVKDFCLGSSGASLATTIEMAINRMNALSKELKIHYIGTAQLNRTGESTSVVDVEDIDRFRPSRHQIKNSGALLERCRYAISLFRKKFYIDQYFPDNEEAQAEDDLIEIQLLKQSNGECKRYYESFNGECFMVTPLVDSGDDLVEIDE